MLIASSTFDQASDLEGKMSNIDGVGDPSRVTTAQDSSLKAHRSGAIALQAGVETTSQNSRL
jgi:hypothetical protein